MHIFLQVAGIGPTADWFTHRTSLSPTSMPPSETTKFSIDISVAKDTDEDNSLDEKDVPTPKNSGDEVQIKEVENEILAEDGRGSRMYEMDPPDKVTSENLWERTEVLAGKAGFPVGLTASLLSLHVWFSGVIH